VTKRTEIALWILGILSAAICGGYVLGAIAAAVVQLAQR